MKRTYGTGSIREIGPGKWRIYVRAGSDEAGRPLRMSEIVYGKRPPEKRMRQIITDIEAGRLLPGQRDTVRSFFAAWWPGKSASLAPSGALGLRRLYERYVLPAIGDRPVQKVTTPEIARMIGALVDAGRVGQADHLYQATRLFFNAAIRARVAVTNPVEGCERPAKVHRELSILTPNQWHLVRNYLIERESWAVLPFQVLLSTGIRRSELVALRWQDFDLAASTLSIVRSLHVLPGGRVAVRAPKTHRGRRLIALDPHTRAALLDHRAAAQGWVTDQGAAWSDEAFIFARHDGSAIRPDSLSHAWMRTTAAFGLRVRLHDLRHSHASLLLAAGADVKVISTRLGHASSAFTLDVYSHLLPNREAEAAERFSRLLNGSTPALPSAS